MITRFSGRKILHTEKSFRNIKKSNRNQIVITIFRLNWNQTDFHLDLNRSENGEYNLISGWFNKISKEKNSVRSTGALITSIVLRIILRIVLRVINSWVEYCVRSYRAPILKNPIPQWGIDYGYKEGVTQYTQRNIFEILLNQTEIGLYLPCTDWFGTKRTSDGFQIN